MGLYGGVNISYSTLHIDAQINRGFDKIQISGSEN